MRPAPNSRVEQFRQTDALEFGRYASTTAAGNLVLLTPAQLKTHPKNMRRMYPLDQVKQMAQSIREFGGLINSMIVTPDGSSGTFYVVDGNMRLAGARFIGEACPPLKAEVVSMEHAEQLLAMVVANMVRFDVDPVSEAQHYQALQAEGLSVNVICEKTGVYSARVYKRLKLLQLDPPIQQMIADGKMISDERVVDSLLAVADPELRVKLASKLEGASAKSIIGACERLQDQLAAREKERRHREVCPSEPAPVPLLQQAQTRSGFSLPSGDRPDWVTVRSAARAMCARCDVKTQALHSQFDEPAWTLIAHEAGEVCGNCSVREVSGACQGCPGVELLSRLIRAAHAKTPTVGEQVPTERLI